MQIKEAQSANDAIAARTRSQTKKEQVQRCDARSDAKLSSRKTKVGAKKRKSAHTSASGKRKYKRKSVIRDTKRSRKGEVQSLKHSAGQVCPTAVRNILSQTSESSPCIKEQAARRVRHRKSGQCSPSEAQSYLQACSSKSPKRLGRKPIQLRNSPPSLSEDERYHASQASIKLSSTNAAMRGQCIQLPVDSGNKKKHLLNLFGSLISDEICDRLRDEDALPILRVCVSALKAIANEAAGSPLRAPSLKSDTSMYHSKEQVPITTSSHGVADKKSAPQDCLPFGHCLPYQINSISERRAENYGYGSFQDGPTRILLRNTPVYSTTQMRRYTDFRGRGMLVTNNTEVVRLNGLDPEEVQTLKDKGFSMRTLQVPQDRRCLTNLQRIALMNGDDTKVNDENIIEHEGM